MRRVSGVVNEEKYGHMTTLEKLEWLLSEIQNAQGFSSNSEYLSDALEMVEEMRDEYLYGT